MRAGRLGLTTPRDVTALVDALEDGGWVTRGPHPTDRRATLITLTDRGATAAERMDTKRRDAAHALFGRLAGADLARFLRVADHLMNALPGPDGAAPRGS